jgi:hypothetical protein
VTAQASGFTEAKVENGQLHVWVGSASAARSAIHDFPNQNWKTAEAEREFEMLGFETVEIGKHQPVMVSGPAQNRASAVRVLTSR